MEISVLIERGFGIGYLVCGLSLFIQPQQWQKFINDFVKTENWFPSAFVAVFLGAFMIAGHNIWELSPKLITTLIAWLALIKGATYLTFPHILTGLAKNMAIPGILRVGGLFVIILSLIILYFSCI